jgi:hypothetical protein
VAAAAASAAALLIPASSTLAIPTVIYSDIVASPTSDVPGIPGAKFVLFDRPYRSPNGQRWIFVADTDQATTSDEVIIAGTGTTGSLVQREGTPVSTGGTELVGLIDTQLFITNAGDFAYATNTDAATTADEVIGRYTASTNTYDVPVREGDPAPGLPGVTLGLSNHSSYIADDGRIGFVGTSLAGTGSTSTDSAVFFGNTVVAQEGITVPAGQAGGGTATWQLFDFEGTFFANNGADYLIQGDTNAASGDDILVRNGTVVLQEAQVVPGSGFASPIATSGIGESFMMPNGDWYSRGNNADGTGSLSTDWLVRNGAVVAATGDAVPGGNPGELFADEIFTTTFFSMQGNNVGDYVYGGVTDNADVNANAVLVFNDSFVFAREGDPVDLNGNGLPDDDAFISVFNNDDAFLTDDLMYYFTADLRNAAGTTIGQAFMVLPIPEPTTLGLLGLSAVGLLRRRRRD